MPATYEPIATTTLGTAATPISFTSIPGTYTDLRLIITGTVVTGGPDFWIRFNSDAGTNYSVTMLQGNGTAAGSFRTTSTNQIVITPGSGSSTTIPNLAIVDIFSYAGSTNKTVLAAESTDKNGLGAVSRTVGLWRNTAAITRIDILNSSAVNFAIGTTATLFGIKSF